MTQIHWLNHCNSIMKKRVLLPNIHRHHRYGKFNLCDKYCKRLRYYAQRLFEGYKLSVENCTFFIGNVCVRFMLNLFNNNIFGTSLACLPAGQTRYTESVQINSIMLSTEALDTFGYNPENVSSPNMFFLHRLQIYISSPFLHYNARKVTQRDRS